MADLPLLLAGPILRRVQPDLVSVWVALSAASRLQIALWLGTVEDTSPSRLFTAAGQLPEADPDPTIPPGTIGLNETIRVGEHLHVGVATFQPRTALNAGAFYSYNLTFNRLSGDPEDLKSLGLLGPPAADLPRRLPLGYEPNLLPGFELVPPELEDLRILHGSCRRINHRLDDGMVWIDDLIAAARTAVPLNTDVRRPHQLFLTGDQIYADDACLPLLPRLTELGVELLGSSEFTPTRWRPPDDLGDPTKPLFWPADAAHFPAGLRHRLIDSEAFFTTSDKHSHLISFGEFAATYLLSWSNPLWGVASLDDLATVLKDFDDILQAISDAPALPPSWGALFHDRLVGGENELDDLMLLDILRLLFSPGVHDELVRALKPGDDRLDMENLQRDALDSVPPALRTAFPTIFFLADSFRTEDGLEADEEEHKLPQFRRFMENLQDDVGGLFKKDELDRRKEEPIRFFHGLHKVQRALANVPTYMAFDDHEITDDWNLNPQWRQQTCESVLGRTIIRNGLLAYTLFQGWGNDPLGFRAGKKQELLQEIVQLYPAGAAQPTEESAVAKAIDRLLGLEAADSIPEIHWHYAVEGPRHKVLVLDNRTRRSFASDVGPPANLSLEAIINQIPEGPRPSGIDVLLVVAQIPVMGAPIFDELVAPLAYRGFDIIAYIQGKRNLRNNMPGTNPDAIEGWVFDPPTFEALLKRLAPYERVVFLSGDVHYGTCQAMSYWPKGAGSPARFAQFTSSGLRNVFPEWLRVIGQSLAIAQKLIRAGIGAERLGWDDHLPPVLEIPPGTSLAPAQRAKLAGSPVYIPTVAWPEGTKITREPDFAWRFRPVRDERLNEDRPEGAQQEVLEDNLGIDPLDGYREITRAHVRQLNNLNHSRQILFANNLGIVRFETQGSILHAIQELRAVHPLVDPDPHAQPRPSEVFCIYDVPLAQPQERHPAEPFRA